MMGALTAPDFLSKQGNCPKKDVIIRRKKRGASEYKYMDAIGLTHLKMACFMRFVLAPEAFFYPKPRPQQEKAGT